MPPAVLLRRLAVEVRAVYIRLSDSRRARGLDERKLLSRLGASTVRHAWDAARARPHALPASRIDPGRLEALAPGDVARIYDLAARARRHEVSLLGSRLVALGERIDWSCDVKSGFQWPAKGTRDYADLSRPNDVKVPWEISRLQWVLPLGQAYLLDGNSQHARACRAVIEDWIAENPYAGSINWAIAMEPAMRVLAWSWLFHAFSADPAWADPQFQLSFLRSLYLHVDFVDRHFERGEINGNHTTADATALVLGGIFFGDAGRGWLERGWQVLLEEIPRQIHPDGVDHEASVPYHRFVFELLFLAIRARERAGLHVDGTVRERVAKMAHFTSWYLRPDGSAPVWGDADDARAYSFGGQNINDHRYVTALVDSAWRDAGPRPGAASEAIWWVGAEAFEEEPRSEKEAWDGSSAFAAGGFYVARGSDIHLFMDCGSVGLGGRGGHGHNDCLAFELWVASEPLITDSGCLTYTSSYELRNAFRATAAHNTPQVDDLEQSRFVSPTMLWALHPDAQGEVTELDDDGSVFRLVGSHRGYGRLPDPVVIQRTFCLCRASRSLTIRDDFSATSSHRVRVPFHLAPGVDVEQNGAELFLKGKRATHQVAWTSDGNWDCRIGRSPYAPSYGVVVDRTVLIFESVGIPSALLVTAQLGTDDERNNDG